MPTIVLKTTHAATETSDRQASRLPGPLVRGTGDSDYVCGNCGFVIARGMGPNERVPWTARPVRPAAPKTNSHLNCVVDPECDSAGAQAGQPILVGSGPPRGVVRHTLSDLLKPSPRQALRLDTLFVPRDPCLGCPLCGEATHGGRVGVRNYNFYSKGSAGLRNDPIGRLSMRMSSHPGNMVSREENRNRSSADADRAGQFNRG